MLPTYTFPSPCIHWTGLTPGSSRKERLRNAWDWSSPSPSPLYARLSGALHPRGSCYAPGVHPEKQGVRERLPQVVSYLRVPTSADHLPSSFFNTTRHPIWETLIPRCFSSRKSTMKNTCPIISWTPWTPGDHFSKPCFLYYNELRYRQRWRKLN